MSVRPLAQTLLGLVLAATPVALWIAWTPVLLACVIAASVLCAVLLVLVTEAQPAGDDKSAVWLSGQFLAEVQRLHPMIHHHSGRRSARFQRVMQRLMRLAPSVHR